MNFQKLLSIFIIFCLFFTVSINGYGFSLLNHLLGIFQKNTKIRANPQITIKSTADLILRGIESKRCEDALCLDCVPGFCRERPVAPTPPNLIQLLNRNGTLNGFPNMTVSGLPTAPGPITNISSLGSGMVGTGLQQMITGSGITNPQNLQNMGSSLSNLINTGSSGSQTSGTSSATSPGFLSSDYETTNSTGGPPVITSTAPPMMCMCSWI